MPKKDTTKDIVQTIGAPPTQEIQKFFREIELKKLLIIILIMVAVGGVYGSWHFYSKYQAVKTNPNLEAQKETEALVSVVGKLMELPKDETPTIATVSDKEKLKDQSFFKSAENGDVLLAYTKAMQAILYRPKTNKIINVAPINLNGGNVQTRVVNVKVAYYNGTPTVGLAMNAEKIMKKQFSNFQTVALSNASKKDYKETIVVDLSSQHSQEVTEVAKLLNGKVAPMPAGEVRPDADILIISGQ